MKKKIKSLITKKPQRGSKFDRQSGTGRRKEVSKVGRGEKGTWGIIQKS